MPTRPTLPLWGVCYLAAACLMAGAVAQAGHWIALSVVWPLGIAGAVAALAGYRLQRTEALLASELLNQRAESDILRAQIQDQSQAIDAIADGLDLAVFVCDKHTTVVYANRTAREMFRFANPMGHPILVITVMYELEQLVLGVARSSQPLTREVTFPAPSDRVAIAKAWPGRDGERIFLSVYEVTNLRRLERVRQDFVANVSHELRTPLSIIRAYAETLADSDPPDPDTARRYLPRIMEEVDRLSGITTDLLVLSSAEFEQVNRQSCDIADVYRSVVIQLQQKAEDKGLYLNYKGPESLVVEANIAQMTQVALNLIANAINYTQKGGVDVTVRTTDSHVIIRVSDTGIGIASEHASRIFERFYRVDKGRSRLSGGTGLGLSIVKHIVEAHDGSVTVESALNRGSEFTIHLPSKGEGRSDE